MPDWSKGRGQTKRTAPSPPRQGLERTHLTWNEAEGTAQNRVGWRVLVEDLCSTRNEED